MNKEDIIRMAQECQLIGMRPHLDGIYQESLERFAALVAAAEREACAKVCEDFADQDSGPDGICTDYHARLIRARGESK